MIFFFKKKINLFSLKVFFKKNKLILNCEDYLHLLSNFFHYVGQIENLQLPTQISGKKKKSINKYNIKDEINK